MPNEPDHDSRHKLTKAEFEAREPELRARILAAQFALRKLHKPVIIIIGGLDGAGKGETVHRLNEWLDPRGVETHAFLGKTTEEEQRPRFWRYWMATPAKGRIAIFFGSWYTGPILRRVNGTLNKADLANTLERTRRHEKQLRDDGFVIVKIWLEVSRRTQEKRYRRLIDGEDNRWRILPLDWEHYSKHEKFASVASQVIEATSTPENPWHVVSARFTTNRDCGVGEVLAKELEGAVAEGRQDRGETAAGWRLEDRKRLTVRPYLNDVDLSAALEKKVYRRRMADAQDRLNALMMRAWNNRVPIVLAFEGWDAAGKGGAIRRMVNSVDPRLFRVVPVAAPTTEEKARHYLWRFWRELPQAGRMTVFDRSWYGRVLVERVEGFASEAEWRRAYAEINEFENQMIDHGIALGKFWLHISNEEQKARFDRRTRIEWKRHKITDEDWRNREKWDAYEDAVNDMIGLTSTEACPWTLVAGNDKRYARVQILESVCEMLERRMGKA